MVARDREWLWLTNKRELCWKDMDKLTFYPADRRHSHNKVSLPSAKSGSSHMMEGKWRLHRQNHHRPTLKWGSCANNINCLTRKCVSCLGKRMISLRKGLKIKNFTRNSLNFRKWKREQTRCKNNWFENFQVKKEYTKTWESAPFAFILANSPSTYSHSPTICFTYLSSKITCIWFLMWLLPMSSITYFKL